MALIDEVMDGQQLDRSDAEFLQIVDAWLAGQASIGTAQVLRHGLVEFGEAADMHLVNDGVGEWNVGRAIALPVKAGIDDDGLGNAGGGIPIVAGEVVAGGHVVRKDGCLPVDLAGDCFGVGIDKELVGVEAQALFRLPGAFDAIAVTLPGLDVADQPVPNESGALTQRDAVDLIPVFIKKANGNAGCVFRKEGKVRADLSWSGAQRIGLTGKQGSMHAGLSPGEWFSQYSDAEILTAFVAEPVENQAATLPFLNQRDWPQQ